MAVLVRFGVSVTRNNGAGSELDLQLSWMSKFGGEESLNGTII